MNEIDTDFLNSVSNSAQEWEKDIEPNDRTLALMEIQGLTKSDLAKRLGFSRQYAHCSFIKQVRNKTEVCYDSKIQVENPHNRCSISFVSIFILFI